jgi:hypothetical protein
MTDFWGIGPPWLSKMNDPRCQPTRSTVKIPSGTVHMEMPPTDGRCLGLLSAYCVGRPRVLLSRDECGAQCDHGQTRPQDCRAVTLSTANLDLHSPSPPPNANAVRPSRLSRMVRERWHERPPPAPSWVSGRRRHKTTLIPSAMRRSGAPPLPGSAPLAHFSGRLALL